MIFGTAPSSSLRSVLSFRRPAGVKIIAPQRGLAIRVPPLYFVPPLGRSDGHRGRLVTCPLEITSTGAGRPHNAALRYLSRSWMA